MWNGSDGIIQSSIQNNGKSLGNRHYCIFTSLSSLFQSSNRLPNLSTEVYFGYDWIFWMIIGNSEGADMYECFAFHSFFSPSPSTNVQIFFTRSGFSFSIYTTYLHSYQLTLSMCFFFREVLKAKINHFGFLCISRWLKIRSGLNTRRRYYYFLSMQCFC